MRLIIIIVTSLLISFSTLLKAQDPTVGLLLNTPESVNGYTLFTSNIFTFLIDNCGDVVKRWKSDYPPGLSAYLLENGNLLRTAKVHNTLNPSQILHGGRIEMFNWDGELLWSYNVDSTFHQHHDIEPLPNGNILILASDIKGNQESIDMGRNPFSPITILATELIFELDPETMEVVWEWHLWDHLIQDYNSELPNFGNISEHPHRMDINSNPNAQNSDWIHANAISYNADLDQIAFSSRNLGEIYIIDHSTTTEEAATSNGGNSGKGGDILYRWGNPMIYDRGTTEEQILYGPHDIKWIPEGYPYEHKMVVFNNGFLSPETPLLSKVHIFSPPMDSDGYNYILEDDIPYGPVELDWNYQDSTLYSSSQSGAQPLSNGNYFITQGIGGRLIEVTPDKEIVWEYINPQAGFTPIPQGGIPSANSIFRATRYKEDYPAFEGRDLTPGLPIEANPYPSTCMIYDNSINIQEVDFESEGLQILANPFSDILGIENSGNHSFRVTIFDVNGKQVHSSLENSGIISISAAGWIKGIYFLRIQNRESGKILHGKVIKMD